MHALMNAAYGANAEVSSLFSGGGSARCVEMRDDLGRTAAMIAAERRRRATHPTHEGPRRASRTRLAAGGPSDEFFCAGRADGGSSRGAARQRQRPLGSC